MAAALDGFISAGVLCSRPLAATACLTALVTALADCWVSTTAAGLGITAGWFGTRRTVVAWGRAWCTAFARRVWMGLCDSVLADSRDFEKCFAGHGGSDFSGCSGDEAPFLMVLAGWVQDICRCITALVGADEDFEEKLGTGSVVVVGNASDSAVERATSGIPPVVFLFAFIWDLLFLLCCVLLELLAFSALTSKFGNFLKNVWARQQSQSFGIR